MVINWNSIKKSIAEMLYPCPVQSVVRQSAKEKYYNEKYPKKDIAYSARVVPTTKNNVKIDVRDFFNAYDSEVRKIVEGLKLGRFSDDEKALKCLNWVIDNIKYVGDEKKGSKEFWQFSFETLYYMNGDCEDGAILLANMLLIAGIPYWKIRLTVGMVTGGAHGYLTYYCERKDRWVVLDWCYWTNKNKIYERKDYKDEGNYLEVWFSWNEKYAFSKGLNDKAKEILDPLK
ncbi:MAG: transglutaminase domain-containing protein [archaeon]